MVTRSSTIYKDVNINGTIIFNYFYYLYKYWNCEGVKGSF